MSTHATPAPPVDLPDPEHGDPLELVSPPVIRRDAWATAAATPTAPQMYEAQVAEVERKVSVGVATYAGYAGGAATALSPAVAFAAGLPLPTSITAVLIVVGGVLAAISSHGRYLQARDLTRAR